MRGRTPGKPFMGLLTTRPGERIMREEDVAIAKNY